MKVRRPAAVCVLWGIILPAVLFAAPTARGQQPASGSVQLSATQQGAAAAQSQLQASEQQTPQQPQQPAEPQGAPQSQPRQQEQTPRLQPEPPKNDRLFWALPNYLTVENEAETPPLTGGQKYNLVARQAFDPIEFPFIGFLALISQAENSEPAYGQGAAGYGKRYGAAFGDATIGSFMTGAVLPAALRQDPRYYQMGEGRFLHRAGYSISRIFVTRADSGRHQFNLSEIAGNLIAAGVANAYHPREDRTLLNTFSIWGTDTGWDTVTNVAKEFWPDIKRMLGGKKR